MIRFRIRHAVLTTVVAGTLAGAATAGPCTSGAGNCCDPAGNGSPGCEVAACCTAVCADDSFCCNTEWDSICAESAAELCVACQGCENSIEILGGTTVFDNTGVYSGSLSPCGSVGSDLWYHYTAPATGQIAIDTCGSSVDTVIAVYRGCDCPPPLADLLACNDDCAGPTPCSGSASCVNLPVFAGQCYHIMVGGANGAQGTGQVTITEPVIGGCCLPDGSCVVMAAPVCLSFGGVFEGPDTTCPADYAIQVCASPFVDISGTGTLAATASSADDDGDAGIPLGFTFSFYNQNHTSVGISSNGYLTFGPDLNEFTNATIPTAATPNHLIAPLWDDWTPNQAGDVHYQTIGPPGGRWFIAQWTDVEHWNGGTATSTFQAVLFEGSNCIEFRYGSPHFYETPTVGVENLHGTDGTPGGNGPPVSSGDCLRLCPQDVASDCPPPCPWDCDGSNDGIVGIGDFLAVLAQWGGSGTSCDTGGPGVGINEFLDTLANWGPCP